MRTFENWSMTLFIFISWNNVLIMGKRGPHHPRSEVDTGRHKVDEHFSLETEHLQEDLHHHPTMPEQNVSEMSEEEKNFYYFKLHDSDNNNALDGLELLQAATHHGGNNHNHHYNHEQGEQQQRKQHQNQQQNPQQQPATNDIDQSDIETADLNENHIEPNKHDELMHIIEAVDDFIEYADVDQDGYLNYAEYTKAMLKVAEIEELHAQRDEIDKAELLSSTTTNDSGTNNNDVNNNLI